MQPTCPGRAINMGVQAILSGAATHLMLTLLKSHFTHKETEAGVLKVCPLGPQATELGGRGSIPDLAWSSHAEVPLALLHSQL